MAAASSELIDGHVDLAQLTKAVTALHAHATKTQAQDEATSLLPAKITTVWLTIALKTIPVVHTYKPYKIPLAHPLIDPRESPICLITKDPQREYKDLLERHNIKFIARVVGVAKLKGKFSPYEARRALLKENALFLADDRVVPVLPKLLGRKWFDAKKQPIPVRLTRKDLKGELERAVGSTYMTQNRGTCNSIKIGVLALSPKQIVSNVKTALPEIVRHIPGGWDNIQSIYVKTNFSVSLPVWTCDLRMDEGAEWAGIDDGELQPDSMERLSHPENETAASKKHAVEKTDGEKKKKKRAVDKSNSARASGQQPRRSMAPSPSSPETVSEQTEAKKTKGGVGKLGKVKLARVRAGYSTAKEKVLGRRAARA